jgi:hypothetical protein
MRIIKFKFLLRVAEHSVLYVRQSHVLSVNLNFLSLIALLSMIYTLQIDLP